MSLIKVKAKVALISEEDMEINNSELGIEPKSRKWVWRTIALPAEEIYRVVSYNSNKCILQMYYDTENILVAETFEEVFKKWEESRQLQEEVDTEYKISNREENNNEGDESSDDEEDE